MITQNHKNHKSITLSRVNTKSFYIINVSFKFKRLTPNNTKKKERDSPVPYVYIYYHPTQKYSSLIQTIILYIKSSHVQMDCLCSFHHLLSFICFIIPPADPT